MLILNGHDYYDSVSSHGIDKTVRLMRQKDMRIDLNDCPFNLPFDFDTKFKCKSDPQSYMGYNHVNNIVPIFITVIVADKKYTGIKMKSYFEYDKFFWTPEDLRKFMDERDLSIMTLSWYGQGKRAKTPNITDFFKKEHLSDDEIKFAINKGISIALNESPIQEKYKIIQSQFNNPNNLKYVKGNFWSINPVGLDKMQFFKVLDPYTIHQELSMWVGGVLPGTSPIMETVSEKIRIEKHGFDSKWSFRKHKDDPKV